VRIGTEQVNRYPAIFEAAYARVLRAKLGLRDEHEDDLPLAADLLERLRTNSVDYTVFFRRLCDSAIDPSNDAAVAKLFDNAGAFHDWVTLWRQRLALEETTPGARASAMRCVNPAFIPRNHRIEELIAAAVVRDDFEPFELLLKVLEHPYESQHELAYLNDPPKPEERVQATFCGT
jgi:uncharacterized protein YdiU (UPF0061 family)